jgi:hypothetical protein
MIVRRPGLPDWAVVVAVAAVAVAAVVAVVVEVRTARIGHSSSPTKL